MLGFVKPIVAQTSNVRGGTPVACGLNLDIKDLSVIEFSSLFNVSHKIGLVRMSSYLTSLKNRVEWWGGVYLYDMK